MNRRKFVKRSVIATPILLGAAAGYARFLERHAVEVIHVDIEIGIPQPMSVALLSDIHFDPLYEVEYLETVIELVNGLSPDFIYYTGDFLSESADRLDELIDVLRKAKAKFGSFAVLGNHDHEVGADQVGSALQSCGIRVLRNESVPFVDRANWFLTGLESYWAGSPNTLSLEKTPPGSRHIVLVHEPDTFDLLTDSRIALQLSGHTHGGQIRLPLVGAIRLPTWGKKYQAGLYERDDRKLYVNRGIGTVDEHYRLNCRPEITLLRLSFDA